MTEKQNKEQEVLSVVKDYLVRFQNILIDMLVLEKEMENIEGIAIMLKDIRDLIGIVEKYL